MADKKISQLTSGSPAQSGDLIPIARSGATDSISVGDLKSFIGGGDILHTVASSTASLAINFATADVWDITLTANCTFTFSGFTNGQPNYLTLVLRQDATGSRTVTWPTITWIGSGVAPTLQTNPSSVDSVVLWSFDGGTTVFGIAQTSASGLTSGTAFPGSPTDRQTFYRTDRDILYAYDLANTRWFSVQEYSVNLPGNDASVQGTLAANSYFAKMPVPYKGTYSVLVTRFEIYARVANTNNGTNYWTFQLMSEDSGGTDTQIGSTMNTSADTINTFVSHFVSPNTVLPGSSVLLTVLASKVGTPGGIFAGASINFRLIG